MKKFTFLLTALTLCINLINASHCSGVFSGSDITDNVFASCDGNVNLVSGNCSGECYDYFDIELAAGESITLSACAGSGAVVNDPTFDIYFSIWDNSPTFDNQVACSDSPGDFTSHSYCSGTSFGDSSEGTEVVFTAAADGIYRVEISDWLGGFTDGNYSIAVSCPSNNVVPNPDVPTLSEWGIITLALLLLNFGSLVLIGNVNLVTNSNIQISSGFNIPLHSQLLNKATVITLLLVALGFASSIFLYGSIFYSDIIGVAIAGPVFAYFIHLLLLTKEK